MSEREKEAKDIGDYEASGSGLRGMMILETRNGNRVVVVAEVV